jgi:hypothetical protein
MRRLSCLLAFALSLHAAETWQAGGLTFAPDAQGRVGVKYGDTVVVNYDQLQLVNPVPAWKVLADLGRPAAGVLSCAREVQDDQPGWELAWEYPAGTGATRCYYFLDLPAALLDGAVCEFETAEGAGRGILPNDCGMMVGLRSIRIHGPELRLDFELGGEGVEWRMTDWSQTPHQSYRLRIEQPAEAGSKASATVVLRATPSSAEALADLRRQWREQEQAEQEKTMNELGLRSRQPLTLGQPRPTAVSVRPGGRFTVEVPLTAAFDNPFDPDDIELEAEFTRPDGTVDRVPGYFDLPAQRTDDGTFTGLGKPVWRLRYTPLVPGSYRYQITVRDRSGTRTSPAAEFVCAGEPFRGFVRVGQERPHSYEFADGTAYQPLGFNLFAVARLGSPYPEDRLSKLLGYVAKLADAGGNFIRLRMDSWWLEIENAPDAALGFLGPGFYNQRVCDEIDRIFDLCEERDIEIMLCLYNANGMVNRSVEADGSTAWRRPYAFFLADNGGPCADRNGFWTDPQARKWARMKLRYSVARWGASPSLFCWEFWNELVLDQKHAAEQVAWHDDMAKFLRATDPWNHPISNSLMSHDLENQNAMWQLPEMDIVQVHSYRGDELPVYLAHLVHQAHGLWPKPFFLGEYGIIHEDHSQGRYPYDPDGVHFHNGLWAPAMAGGSPGAFWFVDGYLDGNNLYGRYTAFANWAAGIPWNRAALRDVNADGFRYDTPPPLADGTVTGLPGDRFAKSPVERFVVDPVSGAVSDAQWFQSMLHMSDARKTCPVLVLDCAGETVLEIRVNVSVGDESNRLLVQVDGGEPLVRAFPAGEGKGTASTHIEAYDNWRTSYGETVEVPLAPGRHEVRLEGAGKDRLEITLGLRNYFRAPPVVVLGQRTDDSAWVWARHRLSTAYNLRTGKTWPPAAGTTVLLADFAPGTYDVEWTDPWTGEIQRSTVQTEDRLLPLPIPPVQRDLAAKIRRR